eukprot:4966109-Heterocapsa_arctica.AAC.1
MAYWPEHSRALGAVLPALAARCCRARCCPRCSARSAPSQPAQTVFFAFTSSTPMFRIKCAIRGAVWCLV